MTQQVIPVQPVPAQTFQVTLGTQNCQITLQQMSTGLYISLSINGTAIISGKLCLDRVNLIRQAYLGFVGWLYFVDSAPGSTGETQPLTSAASSANASWTADSDTVTADSSITADGGSSSSSDASLTSVPLGLNPNYAGLGSRYLLVYESS